MTGVQTCALPISADGVAISVVEVPGNSRDVCFVVVHGFTGSWREDRVQKVISRLLAFGSVVALDMRGHGRSGAQTTLGDLEVLNKPFAMVQLLPYLSRGMATKKRLVAHQEMKDKVLNYYAKTKEFDDVEQVAVFDEHAMQLAAYREGMRKPKALCANVFVSVTKPGLVAVVRHSEDELQRGWLMFKSLLAFWQAKNKHI